MRYNGLAWQADQRQPLLKRPGRRRLNRERFGEVMATAFILLATMYVVIRLP